MHFAAAWQGETLAAVLRGVPLFRVSRAPGLQNIPATLDVLLAPQRTGGAAE
jgi:hypothetical protein